MILLFQTSGLPSLNSAQARSALNAMQRKGMEKLNTDGMEGLSKDELTATAIQGVATEITDEIYKEDLTNLLRTTYQQLKNGGSPPSQNPDFLNAVKGLKKEEDSEVNQWITQYIANGSLEGIPHRNKDDVRDFVEIMKTATPAGKNLESEKNALGKNLNDLLIIAQHCVNNPTKTTLGSDSALNLVELERHINNSVKFTGVAGNTSVKNEMIQEFNVLASHWNDIVGGARNANGEKLFPNGELTYKNLTEDNINTAIGQNQTGLSDTEKANARNGLMTLKTYWGPITKGLGGGTALTKLTQAHVQNMKDNPGIPTMTEVIDLRSRNITKISSGTGGGTGATGTVVTDLRTMEFKGKKTYQGFTFDFNQVPPKVDIPKNATTIEPLVDMTVAWMTRKELKPDGSFDFAMPIKERRDLASAGFSITNQDALEANLRNFYSVSKGMAQGNYAGGIDPVFLGRKGISLLTVADIKSGDRGNLSKVLQDSQYAPAGGTTSLYQTAMKNSQIGDLLNNISTGDLKPPAMNAKVNLLAQKLHVTSSEIATQVLTDAFLVRNGVDVTQPYVLLERIKAGEEIIVPDANTVMKALNLKLRGIDNPGSQAVTTNTNILQTKAKEIVADMDTNKAWGNFDKAVLKYIPKTVFRDGKTEPLGPGERRALLNNMKQQAVEAFLQKQMADQVGGGKSWSDLKKDPNLQLDYMLSNVDASQLATTGSAENTAMLDNLIGGATTPGGSLGGMLRTNIDKLKAKDGLIDNVRVANSELSTVPNVEDAILTQLVGTSGFNIFDPECNTQAQKLDLASNISVTSILKQTGKISLAGAHVISNGSNTVFTAGDVLEGSRGKAKTKLLGVNVDFARKGVSFVKDTGRFVGSGFHLDQSHQFNQTDVTVRYDGTDGPKKVVRGYEKATLSLSGSGQRIEVENTPTLALNFTNSAEGKTIILKDKVTGGTAGGGSGSLTLDISAMGEDAQVLASVSDGRLKLAIGSNTIVLDEDYTGCITVKDAGGMEHKLELNSKDGRKSLMTMLKRGGSDFPNALNPTTDNPNTISSINSNDLLNTPKGPRLQFASHDSKPQSPGLPENPFEERTNPNEGFA